MEEDKATTLWIESWNL